MKRFWIGFLIVLVLWFIQFALSSAQVVDEVSSDIVLPDLSLDSYIERLTPKALFERDISDLSAEQVAQIKSDRIVSNYNKFDRQYSDDSDLMYQVQKIDSIQDGVELFYKAWNSQGTKIAFGDGTVELEKLRVINPPVMVPSGSLIEKKNEDGDVYYVDDLVYDPVKALDLIIADTIRLTGRSSQYIIDGKVGHTTTVVYPSYDGWLQLGASNNTFSYLHDQSSGNAHGTTDTDSDCVRLSSYSATDKWSVIARCFFAFDTSVIGSGNVVDSAVLSIKEAGANTSVNFSQDVDIVSFTPVLFSSIADSDYNYLKWGTTAFASIPLSSISTNAYNDFTLDTAGENYIDVASTTVLGVRLFSDVAGTPPTWSSSLTARFWVYYSPSSGSTNDPKLTIVSSPAPAPTPTSTASSSYIFVNRTASEQITFVLLIGLLTFISYLIIK